MRKSKIVLFIIAIAIPQLVGFIGALFTTPAIGAWYSTIEKPSFNPPNWIFAPVWTALFLLMGISLYLVLITKKSKDRTKAIIVFSVQLALNVLWSFLFFYYQSPWCALYEIILLWLVILATIVSFHKISKIAAYLLVPYILWVSFASILNWAIVNLNL